MSDPNPYMEVVRSRGYHPVLKDGQTHDPHSVLVPTDRGGKQVLNFHADGRGGLVELWRRSWDRGHDAGRVEQVYVSKTFPGIVKGWHLHQHQLDRFVVIRGALLVATFDLLDEQATTVTERVLCADAWEMVTIPPFTAHGWLALGAEPAYVLNLCSREYTGADEHRRGAHDGPAVGVPYNWRKNRDG